MMEDDYPPVRFRKLLEAGAPPAQAYSVARAEGMVKIEALRIVRQLYNLSLADARAVMASVDGPIPGELPHIASYPQLLELLRDELGYCTCADEETLPLLRRFLQAAQDRS